MTEGKKSTGVKAPVKTINKPEGSPKCFGKYVFVGASECRKCGFHVDCKKGSKK